MDDIFVGQLLSSGVHSVTPDTLVEDAAQEILDNDIGSLVVVNDDGGLEGILTSTDFVHIVSKNQPKQTTVDRYMTTDVITATAQDHIQDVADTMIERSIHHIPVVDDTEGVIGIITSTDLTDYVSHVQTSPV